ncbi:30S ribosomal protein S27ae [archaeon]|jgi:ubiquitin-small subunit ribosomal protein S27Ae|nr:30S ribosomal protein S27ae [archaeon]
MAKKQVKNKTPSKKYEKYTIAGDKIEREKTCPKCGPGIFLANHKDRYHCGKCHYVEFKIKKE